MTDDDPFNLFKQHMAAAFVMLRREGFDPAECINIVLEFIAITSGQLQGREQAAEKFDEISRSLKSAKGQDWLDRHQESCAQLRTALDLIDVPLNPTVQ